MQFHRCTLLPTCAALLQARNSIIVGNSAPEVKSWAAAAAAMRQAQQQPAILHLQQQQQQSYCESPQVYAAKASVAAGVLEGLHALGFLQQ
jgi:hypothetical protein